MTARPRRSILSCLLSASVVLATTPSCKKDEPADTKTEPTAEAKAGETKAEETKAEEPPPAKPAAVVDVADEPMPTYPAKLDALLDLVPEDQESFVVVRDPGQVVAALGSILGAQSEAISKQMTQMGMDDAEIVGAALKGISAAFEGTPIELDKGIVVLPKVGSGLIVYASNEPDALPNALSKFSPDAGKAKCAALKAAEGFVACTEEGGEIPEDFAPGKDAAKKKETLVAGLVGLDLDRAIIAGRIETQGGQMLAMSVEPSGGQMVLNVSAPPLQELGKQLGPGTPRLMGMVGSDSGFIWAHAGPGGLEQARKSVPPLAAGAVASLSGEGMLGISDAGGLVLAMAVSDPLPLRSAIDLATGQLGQIPPTLPDGTKIKAERLELEVGGAKLATLHVELSGSKELAPLEKAGFKPEVFTFVADGYAAIYAGGDADAAKAFAAYEPAAPPAKLVENLPPALANDLASEKVTLAIHVPLDGVATDAFRTLAEDLTDEGPMAGNEKAEAAVKAFVTQLAPLSSLSIWSRHDGETVTLRFAIQPFGDFTTEEGKRANEAVSQFLAGKGAKEVFGELATAYPDSPRAGSYAVRMGDESAEALGGIAIIGMLAAIAIPAFTKYIERSKAAGAAAPPPPPAAPQ